MTKVLEGTYRAGKTELAEPATEIAENTPVPVTFVKPDSIVLNDLGISEAQAADARARMATFAEDWDSPEMDVCDDYHAIRRQQDF